MIDLETLKIEQILALVNVGDYNSARTPVIFFKTIKNGNCQIPASAENVRLDKDQPIDTISYASVADLVSEKNNIGVDNSGLSTPYGVSLNITYNQILKILTRNGGNKPIEVYLDGAVYLPPK